MLVCEGYQNVFESDTSCCDQFLSLNYTYVNKLP